ncbi:hypothetical protein [Motilimonas sp. KMU-193]|uniref:hypothetical protein n=1 Tax=Motilimonas sp. KMU-193 TaxID=3388668 RepID=UPI00396B3874
MKPREYQAWAKVRKLGRNRYMMLNGMLMYGVPLFVVMSFIVNQPFAEGYTMTAVAIHLGVWLFIGQMFGLVNWVVNEKRFAKASGQNQQS